MVSEIVLRLAAFACVGLALMGVLTLATGAPLGYAARRHGISEDAFPRGA